MNYTNSPLVQFTLLSPNYSEGRKSSQYNPEGKIDRITIHHMAGNCSIETCGRIFLPESRQASSTYGVGTDGRIGMYCEEKNRPWTSSSRANDYRAVTIEVANDGGAPDWHVSDAALEATIKLCIDICERNGIEKLTFTGQLEGSNLTMHQWFAATGCPGPYLGSKFPYIVERVNAALGVAPDTDNDFDDVDEFSEGDVVEIREGSYYYNSRTQIPSWVVAKQWIVKKVEGDRVVIDKSVDGKNSINSPVHSKDLINLSRETQNDKSDDAETITGLKATSFKNKDNAAVIAEVGPLFTADQKSSGILASVSLAQFILESGYGKSELAQGANNCFGMKKTLSGNTWSGSSWDGTSVYTKKTSEYENGQYVTITADFRKYPNVEASISDHSAYLLGAKNGNKLRYKGLSGETDYKKAAQIIKDGGYATSPTYVEKLCSIIEQWNLTQYDVNAPVTPVEPTPTPVEDLAKGSQGDKVVNLQKDLITLGYDVGPDGADGDFGPNTETAVKKFQKDNNLVADGIVGPLTRTALDAKIKEHNTPKPEPAPVPEANLYQKGSKGEEVEKIQKTLITLGYDVGPDGADGDFGTNTEKAVMKFQKDNGLEEDGIVGPLTSAELDKRLAEHNAKPAAPAFKEGDVVKISQGATYYDGKKAVPSWVIAKTWIVKRDAEGDRVVIDKSSDDKNSINSPINAKYLTLATDSSETSPAPAPVPATPGFKEGDTVKIIASAPKWWTGQIIPSWVKQRTLYVRSNPDSKGTCQVSTLKVGAITGVIETKYLEKV